MGRKKRKGTDSKPFCFYCDREFDDEKVLIQHQKAKHFKCEHCNRKLDTAQGLVVHLLQVHKVNLKGVPNALTGRDDPEMIVYGMDGVPTQLLFEKQTTQKEKSGKKQSEKQQRLQWAQISNTQQALQQLFTNIQTQIQNNTLHLSQDLKNILQSIPGLMIQPNTDTSSTQTSSNTTNTQATPPPYTYPQGVSNMSNVGMNNKMGVQGSMFDGQWGRIGVGGSSQQSLQTHVHTGQQQGVPIQTQQHTQQQQQQQTHTQQITNNQTTTASPHLSPATHTQTPPPLPNNVKLFYQNNFISIEEQRAIKEHAYKP